MSIEDNESVVTNYNLFGDKAEVYKTELLRKNKFPEFKNEYFCFI